MTETESITMERLTALCERVTKARIILNGYLQMNQAADVDKRVQQDLGYTLAQKRLSFAEKEYELALTRYVAQNPDPGQE